MWLDALWRHEMAAIQWGAVIAASLAAAVLDLRTRRIPNALTGPLFLGGLVWGCAFRGLPGLADGLAAAVVLALPFVLLFLLAGGGAGDAKLMGAVGAWLGVRNGVLVLAAVALSGVALAVGMSLARGRLRAALENIASILRTVSWAALGRWRDASTVLPAAKDMQAVPYAVAILAGVCIAAGGIHLWRP
ncbi:MAG: prepilin peptidase [Planctomycetes bacterium]|nr:prepilin peptidase [Planctomycetota bacterium]